MTANSSRENTHSHADRTETAAPKLEFEIFENTRLGYSLIKSFATSTQLLTSSREETSADPSMAI
jgi:hypothetical protein